MSCNFCLQEDSNYHYDSQRLFSGKRQHAVAHIMCLNKWLVWLFLSVNNWAHNVNVTLELEGFSHHTLQKYFQKETKKLMNYQVRFGVHANIWQEQYWWMLNKYPWPVKALESSAGRTLQPRWVMDSYKSFPWGSSEEGLETDIYWGKCGGIIWSHTCTKTGLWFVIPPQGTMKTEDSQWEVW